MIHYDARGLDAAREFQSDLALAKPFERDTPQGIRTSFDGCWMNEEGAGTGHWRRE